MSGFRGRIPQQQLGQIGAQWYPCQVPWGNSCGLPAGFPILVLCGGPVGVLPGKFTGVSPRRISVLCHTPLVNSLAGGGGLLRRESIEHERRCECAITPSRRRDTLLSSRLALILEHKQPPPGPAQRDFDGAMATSARCHCANCARSSDRKAGRRPL